MMSDSLENFELTQNALRSLKNAVYDLDGLILEKRDEADVLRDKGSKFEEIKTASENTLLRIDTLINNLNKIVAKDGADNH